MKSALDSLRLLHVCIAGSLVFCAGGGCRGMGQLLAPLADDSPYARGTWTGRLVSVAAHDRDGGQYAAAALDIETGPRTLRG